MTELEYTKMSENEFRRDFEAEVCSECLLAPPEGDYYHTFGVWKDMNAKEFDMPGLDLAGVSHWNDKQVINKAILLLRDSEKDFSPLKNDTYEVNVKFKAIENAYTNKDATDENEWYLEHTSGYLDSVDFSGIDLGSLSSGDADITAILKQFEQSAEVKVSHSRQCPDRGNPARLSNHYSQSFNFDLEKMICRPHLLTSFVSRGFEKDRDEPSSTRFVDRFVDALRSGMEVYQGLKEAKSKWLRFYFDCMAIIISAIFKNYDDPMVPCFTVLTYGACEKIYNDFNGKITVNRQMYGLDLLAIAIKNRGEYGQGMKGHTNRGYILKYEITVTKLEE